MMTRQDDRYKCHCSDCGNNWISDGEPNGCPNCKGSGTVGYQQLPAPLEGTSAPTEAELPPLELTN